MRFMLCLMAVACLFTLNNSIPCQADLTDDLQGYWQFNNNGFDSSLNQRDLDLIGNPAFGTGLFNEALSLVGNPNQYAQRPVSDSIFEIGMDDFTIQVWINFNSTSGEQTMFEKFTGSDGPGYTLTKLSTNRIQFYAAGGIVLNSNVLNIPTGIWHHVIMRRQGANFTLYLNNKLIGQSNTNVNDDPPSNNPLRIGERQGNQQFPIDGLIDEVAFWNRALSDDEINQLYNNGEGFELPTVVLGDVNLDGVVNLLDVQPFVNLLVSGGYQIQADINQDGVVNLLDVAPFVDLLTGG